MDHEAARYGEDTKSAITKQDAALFNTDEAQIAQIVHGYTGWPVEKMKRETPMLEIQNCDSLDVVEIIMECEERFDITIPDDDAEGIKTLGELFAVVAKHRL